MNVIQAYALAGNKRDEKIDELDSALEAAISITRKGEVTIVLGDCNAIIVKAAVAEFSGQFRIWSSQR